MTVGSVCGRPARRTAALCAAVGAAGLGLLVIVVGGDESALTRLWAALVLTAGVIASGAFLACVVTADDTTVRIRNTWSLRIVPIAEIVDLSVVTKRRWFPPAPFWFPNSWPRTELSVGVVRLRDGREIRIDALIGWPRHAGDVGPTAAELRVEALDRWLAMCDDTATLAWRCANQIVAEEDC
jgi:hypothetical protein